MFLAVWAFGVPPAIRRAGNAESLIVLFELPPVVDTPTACRERMVPTPQTKTAVAFPEGERHDRFGNGSTLNQL